MSITEKQSIERRSEFSQLMRKAQAAKQEGDWFTVKLLQLQMTNVVELIKQSEV